MFANFCDRCLDVIGHSPRRVRGADVEHEAAQHRSALLRVRDFGVKLHGVELARLVGDTGNGAVVGGGHEIEARRHFGDFVAVAHPDVQETMAFGIFGVFDAFEELRVTASAKLGVTEFAVLAGFHFAA